MRTSFPVQFVGNLLGKSREAGSFPDRTTGEVIEYGDAYEIAFENTEGLTQTVRCSLKALDDACDFDVVKAPKFAPVTVLGDVAIGDNRPGSFRPAQVRLAKAA
jgi:hypothetical protein